MNSEIISVEPSIVNPQEAWVKHSANYLWTIQNPKGEGVRLRREVLNPALLELIGPVEGLTVLDAGCGNGVISLLLAEKGANPFGVDFTEKFLQESRKSWSDTMENTGVNPQKIPVNERFRYSDITEKVDFGDNMFDMVVSNLVLMWLPNIKVPLEEFYRVTKPGGRVIVSLFHPLTALAEIDRSDPNHPRLILDKPYGEAVYLRMINHSSGPYPYFHRLQSTYEKTLYTAGFSNVKSEEIIASAEYLDFARTMFPEFLLLSAHKPENVVVYPKHGSQ